MEDELVYKDEADLLIGTRYYIHRSAGNIKGFARWISEAAVKDNLEGKEVPDGNGKVVGEIVSEHIRTLAALDERLAELLERTPLRAKTVAAMKKNRTEVSKAVESTLFQAFQAVRRLATTLKADVFNNDFAVAMSEETGAPATFRAIDEALDAMEVAPNADTMGEDSSATRTEKLSQWDWRSASTYSELKDNLSIAGSRTIKGYAEETCREVIDRKVREACSPEAQAEIMGNLDRFVDDMVGYAVEEGTEYMKIDLADTVRATFEDNQACRELCTTVIPRICAETCRKNNYTGVVEVYVRNAVEEIYG